MLTSMRHLRRIYFYLDLLRNTSPTVARDKDFVGVRALDGRGAITGGKISTGCSTHFRSQSTAQAYKLDKMKLYFLDSCISLVRRQGFNSFLLDEVSVGSPSFSMFSFFVSFSFFISDALFNMLRTFHVFPVVSHFFSCRMTSDFQ